MTKERCDPGGRKRVCPCAEPGTAHCELGNSSSSARVVVWAVSPVKLCEVRLERSSGLHCKGVRVL